MNKHEFIKTITNRPVLFVGENRLDYIKCFLDGYYMSGEMSYDDNFQRVDDYNMQRWLFLKESASIAHAADITGWFLMMRCYGYGKHACDKFREFAEETSTGGRDNINIEDTVARHIYQIYSCCRFEIGQESDREIDQESDQEIGQENDREIDRQSDSGHKEMFNPEISKINKQISKEYYPVSEEIKAIIRKSIIGKMKTDRSYESIIFLIRKMIPENYDDLWVYIQYEQYFLQVRFLYHTAADEWTDNVKIVNNENYYRDLTILHGYAFLIQKEKHENHIISIHERDNEVSVDCSEIVDNWYKIFNDGADKIICNQNTMHDLFSEWRKNVLEVDEEYEK